MIKCIAIDDEAASLSILKQYIEQIPQLSLIGQTTKPRDGLDMIMNLHPDVVFLDIEMRPMSGMEVARKVTGTTKIIFCTAHPEFAVESYELEAVDYLQKPIEFDRFEMAIKKLAVQLSIPFTTHGNPRRGYQFIRTERGKMVKINYVDIDFVKGAGNYTEIYCGPKKYTAYYVLKDVELFLPQEMFCRVHRSYIIPLDKISQIYGREISLTTVKERIPISDQYREAFMLAIRGDEK